MAGAAVPAIANGVGAAASLYTAYKASRPKPGPLGGPGGAGFVPQQEDKIGPALGAMSAITGAMNAGNPPSGQLGPQKLPQAQPVTQVGTVQPPQPNPTIIGMQAGTQGQTNPYTLPPPVIGDAFRSYYGR